MAQHNRQKIEEGKGRGKGIGKAFIWVASMTGNRRVPGRGTISMERGGRIGRGTRVDKQ